MNFRELLEVSSKVTNGWHQIEIDNKSISTSIELLNKHIIHIDDDMTDTKKVRAVKVKGDIVKFIEKELKIKLDLKDKKIEAFIALFKNH